MNKNTAKSTSAKHEAVIKSQHISQVTIVEVLSHWIPSRVASVQCNEYGKFQCESSDSGAVPCRAAREPV